MKKLLLLFILVPLFVKAQKINIIPKPAEMQISDSKESFTINSKTKIVFGQGHDLEKYAQYFNEYLLKFHKSKLEVQGKPGKSALSNAIIINASPLPEAGNSSDKYSLSVAKDVITISSASKEGLFYGIQTLIQLLPLPNSKSSIVNLKLSIPQLSITDYPRFGYRGMHLDVGRHFFPVEFIKTYIDYLALHKFNYFHWHLTEDQGWRIEIKKYPNLTKAGAWRNGTIIGRYPGTGNDNTPYGGYYTQEQVKEIVKYAADRFITVVPEIELPGHGSAAIAAYPWLSCFPDEPTAIPANMISQKSTEEQKKGRIKLVQETWGVFDDVFCAGKDSTFKFLQDVFDEVLALFPSKYIHVGGDECPKANWKRCPSCQARMKKENLEDEHELQSYFIQRMEKYLNSKGRILIGWDEILEGGLAPNAVVMSWRGEEGGIAAAKEHHNVIMTPGSHVYFDHTQSENEDSVTIGGFTTVEKVYSYEPVPKELSEEQAKYVLGAQANVWTEYMKNTKKVEYMIFPRMSALSEVLWTPTEKKNWEDFEKRLQVQFKRYELWKANYSKAYFDIKASILPTEDFKGIYIKLDSKKKEDPLAFFSNAWVEAQKAKSKDNSKVIAKTTGMGVFETIYSSPIRIYSSSMYAVTYKSRIDQNGNHDGYEKYIPIKFNKATGKKITLTNEPSKNYPGDGAFTLVNGVQNEKGLARSKEFLGFSGTDCEALIDLGSAQDINEVIVHTLSSGGSWVYPPKYAEVFTSADGVNFTSAGKADKFEITSGSNGVIKIGCTAKRARYVKVFIKNFGIIPDGMRGAGNPAWLFTDEIEVN